MPGGRIPCDFGEGVNAVIKRLMRPILIAARLLVIAIVPVLATSCTAAVRDVGFVTQGDEATGITRLGVKDPCSHTSGGAASMEGPTPVYPRATLFPDKGTQRTQITIQTLVYSKGPIPVSPRPAPTFAHNDIPHVDSRAFESDDSWQTVVRWYRSAMPKGAEVMTPACQALMSKNSVPMAQFSVGMRTKNYRDVLIAGVPANERLTGSLQGKKAPRTLIVITESLNGSKPGAAR